MNLIENLKWRYATKRYTEQKVSEQDLNIILQAASLAPSSSGLQPFQIFVISNKDLLEKIKPIAFDQPQITECSHLLVFASWDKYTEERLDETFRKMEKGRGMPEFKMDDYKKRILGAYVPLGDVFMANHSARQAYISATVVITQAAEMKIDTTPMEGFNNVGLDQLLELEKLGLKSQLLVALGYRDVENDWNLKMPKYRKSLEELVIKVK